MTILTPELAAKVEAALQPVIVLHDPRACQSCQRLPATGLVTFADDVAFKLCTRCAPLTAIDGIVLTALPKVVPA